MSACRICSNKVEKFYYSCFNYKQQISDFWKVNILLNSENCHPISICARCRSICCNKSYRNEYVKTSVQCIEWTTHTNDCHLCKNFPKVTSRGRKRRHTKSKNVGETTATAEHKDSAESDYEKPVDSYPKSYSIFMNAVQDSCARVSPNVAGLLIEHLLQCHGTADHLTNACKTMENKKSLTTKLVASDPNLLVIEATNGDEFNTQRWMKNHQEGGDAYTPCKWCYFSHRINQGEASRC